MKIKQKLILPASILAAAWMITGPDWLSSQNIMSEKWITLLTWVPVGIVSWMILSSKPGFYACEVRTFRWILGLR